LRRRVVINKDQIDTAFLMQWKKLQLICVKRLVYVLVMLFIL